MARKKAQRSSFGRVRQKGKRWYAEYTGPDAAIHTPGHSFANKIDADGWIATERRLIDLGTWEPPKARRAKEEVSGETVGQWLDRFHDLLEQRPTPPQPSTMQNYRRVARVRITEPYGPGANDKDVCSLRDIALAKLTKADVYRWWDGVQRCYPNAHTINQQAYKRLKAACAGAVEREMIEGNPVEIKEAGKRVETNEKYLPTDAEIAAILNHVPARYRALTSLMLHHGLRIGEAIALERDDVRIEHRPGAPVPRVTVRVKQNAQRISGSAGTYMLVQPPKTKAGYREVPIMAADVPIFLEHLEKYAPGAPTVLRTTEGARSAVLLTSTASGKMVMDTSYRSVLARAKEKAGVCADIDPHCGRNWLITRLAEQGAHLKEIGRLLGQDDVTTILNVYLKVRAERTTSLMEKVNATLEPGAPGAGQEPQEEKGQ
ncbi:tyrosine-type recombinase/integrase [Corynebacterium tuberculostearicum]|uniref:tyrosine-type recombinase/integrase n=1 Tax=Corynebacterium tuberculostearicum TaxID=38304 RepID=UPI0020273E0D|nr:tyrosine-type recombinase/integrase [Corynebacterium tuberculostearicum]MCG7459708.1 tyrosine-type recombinase/integrase [Corynebacterium tuberculostearicum]